MKNRKSNPAVAQRAAEDVLDRNGFKPIDKSVGINLNLVEFLRDGDLSRLNDAELDQFAHLVERIAFGEDRARMLAEKRKVLTEFGAAPEVIEAECEEVVEPQAPEIDDTPAW